MTIYYRYAVKITSIRILGKVPDPTVSTTTSYVSATEMLQPVDFLLPCACVSPGSEGGEDLELSSSEDEREKEERLAKEALKSFAQSYTKVHIGYVRLCVWRRAELEQRCF